MSILILNRERDEVGGQYLVASIHGVEHCVSLDDDYPEQIPDSDDIVHRINADDFNELSERYAPTCASTASPPFTLSMTLGCL